MTRAGKKALLSEALDALDWKAHGDAIAHFSLAPYVYLYVCDAPFGFGWWLIDNPGNPIGSMWFWPWNPLSRKITALHRRLRSERREPDAVATFRKLVREAARKRAN